jgi:hypothetical protein
MSVAYLFRPTKKCHYGTKLYNLPKERFWMGCGAEAIVVLTERIEFRVTAIDISSNAIQACRGIKDARVQDVMTLENEHTIRFYY